jgi:hypothetical protein
MIFLELALLLLLVYFGARAVTVSLLTRPNCMFDPALNPGVFGLQYKELRYPARVDGLEIVKAN